MGVTKLKIPVLRNALLFFCSAFLALGCSSAPKRPAEIFTVRNMTETQLELANRAADQGRYAEALDLLQEARRLAVSADDPRLLIRTGLSWGNILFYMGRTGEAEEHWTAALDEAAAAGDEELAAVSRVYMARSRLLGGVSNAEEVRTQVQDELSRIESPLHTALAWTVAGLAEKELGRWNDGENSIKNALDIHRKNNYLEQAAYDWYLIASIRSVAGDYAGALEALDEALAFDRRAENTYGLGMDWLAVGEVRKKAGNTAEAAAAYRRSGDIFRSLNLEKEAEQADQRLSGL
ncbi:MAG: tetratricopeptide repeat protein [Treponema sp.]|jgi:tetratricopeptide (TPR) repeat protein|nr:tetratricopeptide repeat protein [Treponema sp.]